MPWLFVVAPAVLACTSGWMLFRLYTDKSAEGKSRDQGTFLALVPLFFAAGLVLLLVTESAGAKGAARAVREHRCVWTEGLITRHSRPGELEHGSMSFTAGGTTFFYDDLGPGFQGPMCVAGAPCDGDYVRVCRHKAQILAIQRRTAF